MQILEVLPKFLVQLEADGRGWSIRAQYERHIRCIDAWLVTQRRSRKVVDLDHEVIAAFFGSPEARLRPDGTAKKPTSVNVMRSSIRNFGRYLHVAGFVTSDPTRMLRRARCRSAPPRWLTSDESDVLLAAIAADKSAVARRDLMFTQLLLATGLRLATALALTDADVDLSRRLLTLRVMKNDAADLLPLSQAITKKLRTYLRGRTRGPLFTNGKGQPLTRRQTARRLEVWSERAGLPRRVTCHQLRHSFARVVYAKTRDISVVQALLRHRSIASTTIYAKPDAHDLRRALA